MRITVIVTLILTAVALYAQSPVGGIQGVLTDSTGAVIPAATIVVSGNGAERNAQTQADGTWSVAGLAAAGYKIAVVFPGFAPFHANVTVEPGVIAQLPIQLVPVASRQEVSVSAEATAVTVEPEHNASATVVKERDLDALPDDPDDLSDMLTALAGPTADGNDATLMIDGFLGGSLPPKNTIKEIRLSSNPFSAEYDDLGFGRIEIITKPGTDTLHGSFQLTDSDAFFNSRNPYAANKADYVNRAFTETVSGSFAHKASWNLNANQGKVDTDAIIHAVALDPTLLTPLTIDQSVTTPRNRYNAIGRFDYQIDAANTVTARYAYYHDESENNGVGGYSLLSRAWTRQYSEQDLHISETAVLNPSLATETHFRFEHDTIAKTGDNSVPSVVVAGASSFGSAQVGNAHHAEDDYDAQNISTWLKGGHTLRFGARFYHSGVSDYAPANFGGTLSFFGVNDAPALDANNNPLPGPGIAISSLEQYRRTLVFEKMGYSPATIQALGGGASQFSVAGGNPYAEVGLTGGSAFLQDDWKILPNLTISPGLRFEKQSQQRNAVPIAPRIGLAWSPDSHGGKAGKTVIRLGAGVFYDRFWLNPLLQVAHLGGSLEQQYLITNPTFYSTIPSLSTLAAAQQTAVTWKLDPKIDACLNLMQAATLERQLPRNSTLTLTFLHITGTHVPDIINANTPLPGTYNPDDPSSGVRPLGNAAGNVFEYQSNGIYNQKLTIVKWEERLGKKVSLTTNYTLRFANNDDQWMGMPSNPYNLMQDYSRAPYDRRHSLNVVGSIQTVFGLQFSPMLLASSGQPYDVTTGTDLNGDTSTSDRPAFATDLTRPSVVITPPGAFDTAPLPGQKLVPRDYLVGPGMWNLNARLGRTFAVGRARVAAATGTTSSGGSEEKRFKLNFNIDVANVFNHLNPGNPVGTLSSPLFGQSTALNPLFRETSNLRRVQFGTTFSF